MGRKKAEAVSAQWFQILLAIVDGPLHGSAIMEEVLERTDGVVRLWPGVLYGSLAELSGRGWIRETKAPEGAPTEGGRRRFWAITASGRRVLEAEVGRLESLVRTARSKGVLRGKPA